MRIDLICKGCNYNVQEADTEHSRAGYCNNCHAKGIGLPQIKRVEKWQARDGSYHDSLEAAEKHQLMKELHDALSACEGRRDDQARHLLYHFNIVRKGDTSLRPATVEYRLAPKTICTTCYFVSGSLVGALLTAAVFWFR